MWAVWLVVCAWVWVFVYICLLSEVSLCAELRQSVLVFVLYVLGLRLLVFVGVASTAARFLQPSYCCWVWFVGAFKTRLQFSQHVENRRSRDVITFICPSVCPPSVHRSIYLYIHPSMHPYASICLLLSTWQTTDEACLKLSRNVLASPVPFPGVSDLTVLLAAQTLNPTKPISTKPHNPEALQALNFLSAFSTKPS